MSETHAAAVAGHGRRGLMEAGEPVDAFEELELDARLTFPRSPFAPVGTGVEAFAELTRDHERRLLNQRAFPGSYVKCSCEGGCPMCAYTGLISRAEAKRFEPPPAA